MWHLQTDSEKKRVIARDETLRDGNQGEVPRSAYRAIQHVLDMAPAYDMMSLGWIYVNPSDIELAKYLREHGAELTETCADYNKDKFFIYTLVHRGGEETPEQVVESGRKAVIKRAQEQGQPEPVASDIDDKLDGFSKMLLDLESGNQPYRTINILTKARANDLKDFGESTTSESFRHDIVNTMRLIWQANPDIHIEIALEHTYTAWLEKENQQANRQHIVDTLVDYLLELGPERLAHALITAPDTDGAHKPGEISQVIKELTQALQQDQRLTSRGIRFDPAMFIAHMHDDLGHAAENTKAALEAGAGAFDSTAGIFGERKGNCTTLEATKVLETEHAGRIADYQAGLEQSLGVRAGDKQVGAPEAFCAVGGMHADRLLKGLREQQKHGVTYNEFVRGYRGSYASAPADMFGQALQVTLSPVAGASNVLFMLAGLGLDLNDKRDPRIAEVLAEVKEGEFKRGMNYRGYNNANTFLLLADKFGLREHDVFAGSKKNARNNLRFSFDFHADGYDSGIIYAGNLSLSPDTLAAASLKKKYISPHRDAGWDSVGGYNVQPDQVVDTLCCAGQEVPEGANPDRFVRLHTERAFDFYVAQGLVEESKRDLAEADKRFADLELLESRRFEMPVGAVRAQGDATKPKAEKSLVGVKLLFTTGTPEKFQANGVGETYEKAMGMAVQTMLDFKLFQIERERIKAGESPILDVQKERGAKRWGESAPQAVGSPTQPRIG